MTVEATSQAKKVAAEIVEKLEAIATLPEVTARIIKTVNDENSDTAELNQIIGHDPALVARLLKVVNSSFYGRSRQITSVERAIVLLGFDNVQRLAIAASMGQMFKGVKLCQGFTAKDLWTHCIGVGVIAKALAEHVCRPMAEEAFMAGLVHDVGLLAMLQVCPDKVREVCEAAKAQPTPFCKLEWQVMGTDHQETGAALAAKWGFPPVCAAVAEHHHRPAAATEPWWRIAGLVYIADALCCQERIGFNLTAAHQAMEEGGVGGLVPPPVIRSVTEELSGMVWTAVNMFG